jgi:soluble lytic murein transglycosylase-like protein
MDGQIKLEPIGFLQQVLNQTPFWISALVWITLIVLALVALDRLVIRKWNILPQLRAGNNAVAIVTAAVIIGMCMIASKAVGAPADRYDEHFQRATRLQWGASVPWTYAKAQAMTESAMNPNACSIVKACGLMQFMPLTARDFGIDPFDPRASIYAGVDYMRRLYGMFSAPRPHLDRYAFAAASYNWGAGNVIHIAQPKAKAAFGADNLWQHIEPFLPDETAQYWPRIQRWQARFSGAG